MPKCPYCSNSVTLDRKHAESAGPEIRREKKGFLKKEIMYVCPHCDRVLGFATYFGGLLTGRP